MEAPDENPVEPTDNPTDELIKLTPSRKRRHVDVDSDQSKQDDDGMLCSVCLDVWTSAGEHRLCSLKCGHLFGRKCVIRWLSGRNKVCPQCNTPARKNDIREIYATKLVVVDNNEAESLRCKSLQLQLENSELRMKLQMEKELVEHYKSLWEREKSSNDQKKINSSDNSSNHIMVNLKKNFVLSNFDFIFFSKWNLGY